MGILRAMDARQLAVLTADAWAIRHACPELTYERPDELHRRAPAVDLLGRDSLGRPRLVLEHTLIESFLDQRTAQMAAIHMLRPLERQFSGQLSALGHYDLMVKPSSVLGLKREVERIREWVANWVREIAPTLAIGAPGAGRRHFATVAVPGTDLEVSLYRWPRRDGQFGLTFEAPPAMGEVLAPSLERAICAKCPKLAAAKAANAGAASLLLLEICDIALGNLFDLDTVVQAQFVTPIAQPPDHIWLVDTTDEPPSVMISKNGARMGEALGERFLPFGLRLVDARKHP
jgi:hypothetical protein